MNAAGFLGAGFGVALGLGIAALLKVTREARAEPTPPVVPTQAPPSPDSSSNGGFVPPGYVEETRPVVTPGVAPGEGAAGVLGGHKRMPPNLRSVEVEPTPTNEETGRTPDNGGFVPPRRGPAYFDV